MGVLVTASYLQGRSGAYLSRLQAAGFSPELAGENFQLLPEQKRIERLKPFQHVICGIEQYSASVLEQLPKLRILSRAGVGLDNVDLAAAARLGIAVTNVRDGNTEAVAEHTVAMMLALCRRVNPLNHLVQNGGWTREPTPVFRNKTLGLWGYGNIAQTVAKYSSAFGVKIIVHSRRQDINGVNYVSWEALLSKSDFLSVHVPLSNETEGRLDYKALCMMKPTGFLINTARGKIIPTQDLVRVLSENRIAGAALDVFEEEPLRNNPFEGLKNVILSPHIAGVDEVSVETLAMGAAENLIAWNRQSNSE